MLLKRDASAKPFERTTRCATRKRTSERILATGPEATPRAAGRGMGPDGGHPGVTAQPQNLLFGTWRPTSRYQQSRLVVLKQWLSCFCRRCAAAPAPGRCSPGRRPMMPSRGTALFTPPRSRGAVTAVGAVTPVMWIRSSPPHRSQERQVSMPPTRSACLTAVARPIPTQRPGERRLDSITNQ